MVKFWRKISFEGDSSNMGIKERTVFSNEVGSNFKLQLKPTPHPRDSFLSDLDPQNDLFSSHPNFAIPLHSCPSLTPEPQTKEHPEGHEKSLSSNRNHK
jgi:hypothetical protein